MPNAIDITGLKFGRLTAIHVTDKRYDGGRVWLCVCDCGNTVEVSAKLLKRGNNKSCGCYKRDQIKRANTTHGACVGYKRKHLYRSWNSMINRCNCISQLSYKHYGGRGITVCDEWKTFDAFNKWAMENGYQENLSIERIDVNGNYCPDNCTWIPLKDQNKNRRNSIK